MEDELNETERQSEIMNLIGYGLAKFDLVFAKEFGCKTKTAFNKLVVELGSKSFPHMEQYFICSLSFIEITFLSNVLKSKFPFLIFCLNPISS